MGASNLPTPWIVPSRATHALPLPATPRCRCAAPHEATAPSRHCPMTESVWVGEIMNVNAHANPVRLVDVAPPARVNVNDVVDARATVAVA
jgi:hypothetical protein